MKFKSIAAALLAGVLTTSSAYGVVYDVGNGVNNSSNLQPDWIAATAANGVTYSGVSTSVDSRDRGTANTNTGDTANNGMWRDFIFANGSNSAGEGLNINVAGLAANTAYKVNLWGYDESSNNPARSSTWNGAPFTFSGSNPDPASLSDNMVTFGGVSDNAGNLVLEGRVGASPQSQHNVFVNGFELVELAPTGIGFAIDIDSTQGGSSVNTESGFTSLNVGGGSTGNVVVDGTNFAVFSADGSRNRNFANDLTRDFVFDDGPGQAVGLRVFDLPDGIYQAEVWAFDAAAGAGNQIVGITNFGGPETIFTTNFASNGTTPFTFVFDSSQFVDGFGIFTREATNNRSRFNGLRLTQLDVAADVPEPATATLALLGLGSLMMRRRRHSSAATSA